MKHLVKPVLWIAFIIALIGLILATIERAHCAYAGYSMNRDTHYAPFIGCLIDGADGKRIPLSSLREVE